MQQISRRRFLFTASAALATVRISRSAQQEMVPKLLDHILVGSPDLDAGIKFVEERTGVRAAFGGVHPGAGTRNALLSLGSNRYLEIIAPDPNQPASATETSQWPRFRATCTQPRHLTLAVARCLRAIL
jgi:glyoxalase-like protein